MRLFVVGQVQYEVIYVSQEGTRYSVGRGVDWYFLEHVLDQTLYKSSFPYRVPLLRVETTA